MIGIGGTIIVVNSEGDSEFGIVGYHPKSGMNILSIGELLDECFYIELSKQKRSLILQMKENGPVYIFKRVNNQFICNLKTDVCTDQNKVVQKTDQYHINKSALNTDPSMRKVFNGVATLAERMKLYSKAEVTRAEMARE